MGLELLLTEALDCIFHVVLKLQTTSDYSLNNDLNIRMLVDCYLCATALS